MSNDELELQAETMNMMEINIKQFTDEIRMDLEDGNYDPIIGLGKSGIGKTVSIAELAQELGIGYKEIRLVAMQEQDLLGVPEVHDHRTSYAANTLLPDADRDGEVGLLVFDEITSCSQTLRAAAYQLLDSQRSVGNYHLPEKWKVVALGNGLGDGGVFTGMESAFLSRATCFRVDVNFNIWKNWATAHDVNKTVVAFLENNKELIHKMNPDDIATIFPCPRSWTALSKKLNAREKRASNGILSPEQVEIYAAGAIGSDVASSFAAFYAYNRDVLSVNDILAGRVKAKDMQGIEQQAMYITIREVVSECKKILEQGNTGLGEFTDDAIKIAINIIRWVGEASSVRLDYATVALNDMMQGIPQFRDLVLVNEDFSLECPEFTALMDKLNLSFTAR